MSMVRTLAAKTAWVLGAFLVVLGIALGYFTRWAFVEYAAMLAVLGVGHCIAGHKLAWNHPAAYMAEVALCVATALMMVAFPFLFGRNMLLLMIAAPLATGSLSTLAWSGGRKRDGNPEAPVPREPECRISLARRPAVTLIVVVNALAFGCAWFGWDLPNGTARSAPGRFTKGPDGTIIDQQTKLEWRVGPSGVDWDRAEKWAAGLESGGAAFRLPTSKELRTLYGTGPGPKHIDLALAITDNWLWLCTEKRGVMAGYYNVNECRAVWNFIGPGHLGQAIAVRRKTQE